MTPDGGAARSLVVAAMLGVVAEPSTLLVAVEALEAGPPKSPVMALWADAAGLDSSAADVLAAEVLAGVAAPIGLVRDMPAVVAPSILVVELEIELVALCTRTAEGACTARSRRPLRSTRSGVRSHAVGDTASVDVDAAHVVE